MESRNECPCCDSFDTDRVETIFETDTVIEVRACNDCFAGFEVEYGDPIVEVTHEPEADA